MPHLYPGSRADAFWRVVLGAEPNVWQPHTVNAGAGAPNVSADQSPYEYMRRPWFDHTLPARWIAPVTQPYQASPNYVGDEANFLYARRPWFDHTLEPQRLGVITPSGPAAKSPDYTADDPRWLYSSRIPYASPALAQTNPAVNMAAAGPNYTADDPVPTYAERVWFDHTLSARWIALVVQPYQASVNFAAYDPVSYVRRAPFAGGPVQQFNPGAGSGLLGANYTADDPLIFARPRVAVGDMFAVPPPMLAQRFGAFDMWSIPTRPPADLSGVQAGYAPPLRYQAADLTPYRQPRWIDALVAHQWAPNVPTVRHMQAVDTWSDSIIGSRRAWPLAALMALPEFVFYESRPPMYSPFFADSRRFTSRVIESVGV